MPSPEELRQLVDRYCAVTGTRDVEAYVALFTEDAVQLDPAGTPPHVGHEGIRAFRQGALDACRSMAFEARSIHTAGDQVAFDFRVAVELEAGSMVIEGIEVFTAAEDGRIKAVTAYWDGADVTMG